MTLLIWLVNNTYVVIDPIKVHDAVDTEHPGTIFCDMFACATKSGMSCYGRGGVERH